MILIKVWVTFKKLKLKIYKEYNFFETFDTNFSFLMP